MIPIGNTEDSTVNLILVNKRTVKFSAPSWKGTFHLADKITLCTKTVADGTSIASAACNFLLTKNNSLYRRVQQFAGGGECITNCIIHRVLINENLSVRYIGLSSAGIAAWFQSFRSQVTNPRCSGPSAMVMKGLLKFLGQVILLTKIFLQGFTRASRGVCWQQQEFSSINQPARCWGA